MGYRSDLDAAQARADALEKRLASGQDENAALRQELEDLKTPKKTKPPKRKEKKAARAKGALGRLFPASTLWILGSLLAMAGAGFWSYRMMTGFADDYAAQEAEERVLVESFVAAWADQRYDEAWALTRASYRATVSKERFVREMRHHSSVQGVSGATLHDRNEGILHTSQGDLKIKAVAHRGEFLYMITDGFDLLPPSDPALISGHRFVRALIDKRFEAAWQVTHPIYRKGVTPELFAQGLVQNIWLTAATGFRLADAEGETTNELRGLLLTREGSVGLVLNFTDGGEKPWISEMIIGGKPSLPNP